jgi:ribosomal protein L15
MGKRPAAGIKDRKHVPVEASAPGSKVARCLSKGAFLREGSPTYLGRPTLLLTKDLEHLGPRENLELRDLKEAGLVKREYDGVKVLGEGDLSFPVVLKVHRASKTARAKIEAAGGKVEIL